MSANDRQEGGEHYKKFGQFQPWDVLRHWLTPEEYRGYMKGTMIAYLAREQDKGKNLDIRKVAHYSQKLVEVLDQFEREDSMKAPPPNGYRPSYYTEREGGDWISWHWGPITESNWFLKRSRGVITMTAGDHLIQLHAVKFSDGREWDCKNGWRQYAKEETQLARLALE